MASPPAFQGRLVASFLQVSLAHQALSRRLDSTRPHEDNDDYTPRIKAAFMCFLGLGLTGLLQAFRGVAKFRTIGRWLL